MSASQTEESLLLHDGRTLGYAEFGEPDGVPVFYCHGFPGSRLDWLITDTPEESYAGARVIAIDRPGCGLSDPQPGRTMLDWPLDVAELADALGIDRYIVLGISGGGPYALACGVVTPERVSALGVVCGMGPADAPGMRRGVSWSIPGKPRPVRRMLLALTAMGIRKDPDQFLARSAGTMAAVDARYLEGAQRRDAFVAGLAEAFRSGARGAAVEATLYRRPWGFSLSDVSVPVHLWHGELVENVPISVARYLAEELPKCMPAFMPDEGHLTIGGHTPAILSALVDSSADAAAERE